MNCEKCPSCGSTERSYFVFVQTEIPQKYIHLYGQLTKAKVRRKGVRFIDTKWDRFAEVCSNCYRLMRIIDERHGNGE